MDPTPCAFCDRLYARADLRRAYELDVCETCACGGAEVVLRDRGHTIVTREWQTRERVGQGSVVIHHYAITARPPRTIPIRASFSRESTLDRLIRVFRPERDAGEPLFDDFVYLNSRDRAQVTALLDSGGAQETLVDLVSRFSGVFFDGGGLEVRERGDAPVSPDAAAMLAVCAMLIHLERAAARA